MSNQIKVTGGKKEQAVRIWLNENHDGQVPNQKVLDLFYAFQDDEPDAEISYGSFNGVLKKVTREGHGAPEPEHQGPQLEDDVDLNVICVEDLEFPNFKLHRTGKMLDTLFSDHEEGGGLYGGTVNIVIGESGVGKSTVLLDMLSSIKSANPESKVLYISSEMTRNDILFYFRKSPEIGQVPTLLLMDYLKSGQLSAVLRKAFNGDYDVIVLDSYQDVLVKLKEVHNWKSTYAEGWLTNLMVDAAEQNGVAICAIQHMTKGGTYVGSTYLKHATTAMLEIRFDSSRNRYIEFVKNRRGGSGVNKPLYYGLRNGSVVYDTERFNTMQEASTFSENETTRQEELNRAFESMFFGDDTN